MEPFPTRLIAFLRRRQLDQELDAELASHLELAADDFMARGMSPREAQRAARLSVGSLETARELHRESRGLPRVEIFLRDLRIAVRSLRRDRGFSAVSVAILALGLAAATTVLDVVHAVLLEPLPFERPQELVWVSHPPTAGQASGLSAISPGHYLFEEWRDRNRSFSGLSAYNAFFAFESHKMNLEHAAARLVGVEVAQDLFEVLGVSPAMGRGFDDLECAPNGPRAVLLSDQLWRETFQAEPDIVGRTLLLEDEPATVIGVLPADMDFAAIFAPGTRVDLFTPLIPEEARKLGNTLGVVGRLKPGVRPDQAQAELMRLNRQVREEWSPLVHFNLEARVTPLLDHVSGDSRRGLWILLACVGVMLMIACANLSGLQLSRALSRRREFAIRTALGSGRLRLISQLVTESLLLVLVSGVLGLGLAFVATASIARWQSMRLPLLHRVEVDGAVVLFLLALTLLVGLLFALMPILQLPLRRLNADLKDGGRGISGNGWAGQARRVLVVVATTLACTLLVAASLLTRSLSNVLDVDLGFRPRQAVVVTVDGDATERPLDQRLAYFDRLVEAARAVPGVTAAGASDALPLDRNRTWWIWRKGDVYEPGKQPEAFVSRIGSGYLSALGVPLFAGRDFDEREQADSSPVVIVNRAAADFLFPEGEAVGQIAVVEDVERRIVGVVGDVQHRSIEATGSFEIYLPMAQSGASAVQMVVRAEGPRPMAEEIRTALHATDPTLPIDDLRQLGWLVDREVSFRRFLTRLLAVFAGFSLLLAGLGIYGVLAYSVRQRKAEISIRIALGASTGRVWRLVLRESLLLAGSGLAFGMVGAVVLGHVMRSMLFGIAATDALSFAFMLAALLGIATVAGSLPAFRAAQIEPASVLRSS